MPRALLGKLNLEKLDKSKFFKGKKGTYVDVIVWINDEKDSFGNIASVQQTLTKEERDAGAPKIYLGNLEDLNDLKARFNKQQSEEAPAKSDEEDLPF